MQVPLQMASCSPAFIACDIKEAGYAGSRTPGSWLEQAARWSPYLAFPAVIESRCLTSCAKAAYSSLLYDNLLHLLCAAPYSQQTASICCTHIATYLPRPAPMSTSLLDLSRPQLFERLCRTFCMPVLVKDPYKPSIPSPPPSLFCSTSTEAQSQHSRTVRAERYLHRIGLPQLIA